jgi:hypothetical protein
MRNPARRLQPPTILWRSSPEEVAIVEGMMKSKPASETPTRSQDHSDDSPLAGELMDLYAAMLIVIPIAFILKSLWV